MDGPRILFWRGRDIRTLGADELEEACLSLASDLAQYTTHSAERAFTLGRAEMKKRGEPYLEPFATEADVKAAGLSRDISKPGMPIIYPWDHGS